METDRQTKIGMPLQDILTWLGVDWALNEKTKKLFAAYDINPATDDPKRVIPADDCWRLFTEHAALVDDELHNALADRLRAGGTNLIVARMLLCDTVHEAINAYSDAWRIVSSDMHISVARRASGLSLRWSISGSKSEFHPLLLETTAATFYAIFCWMADEWLKVLRTVSMKSRETSGSSLLDLMGAPVIYKGDDVEIVFSPEVAEVPVVNSEIEEWRDGVHSTLKSLVARRTSPESGGVMAERVKTLLQAGHDQTEIAEAFKMSTKTLARRLSLEGCSFRDLANEVKCQRATSLIHAGLTVESISEQLGYEDTRSFRRAFRRWMGASPSQYRASLFS